MPTNLDYLVLRKTAIHKELSELSTSKVGGGVNSSGAGVGVDHSGYKKSLYEELTEIDKRISIEQGSFEIIQEL